jgi:hypothetical protein
MRALENNINKIIMVYFIYGRLGAGATPLTGEISVVEYHARQLIMWSSPVSLDINLKPVGQGPFLVSIPK